MVKSRAQKVADSICETERMAVKRQHRIRNSERNQAWRQTATTTWPPFLITIIQPYRQELSSPEVNYSGTTEPSSRMDASEQSTSWLADANENAFTPSSFHLSTVDDDGGIQYEVPTPLTTEYTSNHEPNRSEVFPRLSFRAFDPALMPDRPITTSIERTSSTPTGWRSWIPANWLPDVLPSEEELLSYIPYLSTSSPASDSTPEPSENVDGHSKDCTADDCDVVLWVETYGLYIRIGHRHKRVHELRKEWVPINKSRKREMRRIDSCAIKMGITQRRLTRGRSSLKLEMSSD